MNAVKAENRTREAIASKVGKNRQEGQKEGITIQLGERHIYNSGRQTGRVSRPISLTPLSMHLSPQPTGAISDRVAVFLPPKAPARPKADGK
jgi:hypothetical protein